jgi:MoaA/NifB/PqqE/SkfB family radical SAM enzyme
MENAARCRYVDRLQVGCCFKPWYYMVIRENGDVGERSTLLRNTVKHAMGRVGNIRETTVEGIWLSERYRAFRARCKPPQFEECSRCCYRFALLNKGIEDTLDGKEGAIA